MFTRSLLAVLSVWLMIIAILPSTRVVGTDFPG